MYKLHSTQYKSIKIIKLIKYELDISSHFITKNFYDMSTKYKSAEAPEVKICFTAVICQL